MSEKEIQTTRIPRRKPLTPAKAGYFRDRTAVGSSVSWMHKVLWRRVLEKMPLFAGISVASCIITYFAQQQAGAMRSATGLSLGMRIENSLLAYVSYLFKTIWPTNLAALYPLRSQHNPAWSRGPPHFWQRFPLAFGRAQAAILP